MEENLKNDALSIWLKPLRLLCVGVLLIPIAVLVFCALLMTANSNAGWLKFPLPIIFFLVYVVAGLASPLVGVAALVTLWVGKHKFTNKSWFKEHRLERHILILGLADIFAIAFWVMLFPFVFFSAGDSR